MVIDERQKPSSGAELSVISASRLDICESNSVHEPAVLLSLDGTTRVVERQVAPRWIVMSLGAT